MGGDLFARFADLTATADEVLGYSIEESCIVGRRLADTRYTQPAIFVVNALAAHRHIADSPEPYEFFAGHSLGEYNALVAAGVLDFRSALELVRIRGQLMSRIRVGGMAVVQGLDAEAIEQTLRRAGCTGVFLANHNSDRQMVVAGHPAELAVATTALKRAGAAQVAPLAVSGPFHTPLMTPAVEPFRNTLSRYEFHNGKAAVISSVTGKPFQCEFAADLLSEQISTPVVWTEVVRTLRAAGVTQFDEVNGTILSGLMRDIN
jgi:malonyl CoA-acyl carrier protein transacylase